MQVDQEAEERLKLGQIVRLNSGSPELLVTGINGDAVTVAWQTETTLPAACLQVKSQN